MERAMGSVDLLEHQVRLLELLVEASRKVSPSERHPFLAVRDFTTSKQAMLLSHPGVPEGHPEVYEADLRRIERLGFIEREPRLTDWEFEVTAHGFRHYDELKQRMADSAARVEETLHSYLDISGITQRHPAALAKWREADRHLWSGDLPESATTIGHLCREALQEFATSLLGRHPAPEASEDKALVKARLRAVLQNLSIKSTTLRGLTPVLGDYLSVLVDLYQRQEHGGHKEGETLQWEDSRRLVFQILFLMSEIDRLAELE